MVISIPVATQQRHYRTRGTLHELKFFNYANHCFSSWFMKHRIQDIKFILNGLRPKKWVNLFFKKKFQWRSSTISFSVRVPVLSDSRYPIRPSSSGIVLLRTTVPGMFLSCIIIHEYTTLPRSKLTRRLQGKIKKSVGRMSKNGFELDISSTSKSETHLKHYILRT